MKNLFLGSTALIVLGAGAASAADMPVKAPAPAAYVASNWTGLYVGASGGYAWGRSTIDLGAITPVLFPGVLGTGEIPAHTSYRSHSAIGGLQAGFNVQHSNFVFGAEGDISSVSLNGASTNVSIPAPGFPVITTTQQENLDWLATFRGRLGYTPLPSVLAYVTGGLAAGHVSASTITTVPETPFAGGCSGAFGGNFFCSRGGASNVRAGWTAGAGLEAMFWSKWSAKIEYLHFDLGRMPYTNSTSAPVFFGIPVMFANASFRGDLVRVGLNYHFLP